MATLKIQSSKNELSQPWNQAFFRLTFSKKYSFPWPKSSKVKNCPNLTVKRAKNNKKSPKNELHKGLQSSNLLQHPVVSTINYGPTVRWPTVTYSDPVMSYLYWPYTPPLTCTYLNWSIILGIMRGMVVVVEGCGWQPN